MSRSPERWIFCQCSDDTCAFRFPAAVDDPRRHRCPLCGAPTQRTMLAAAASKPSTSSDSRTTSPLHLLLDNLRSSYNVGSLFRTADGAGVDHVHLCGITPTPTHAGVGKTALGAETRIPWTHHRNALHAAGALQQTGHRLWALETHPTATSLFAAVPPNAPLVLVIGNEVAGVDPALLARCDRIVRLPMVGSKRSLNVASAAAVALYWLRFGAR